MKYKENATGRQRIRVVTLHTKGHQRLPASHQKLGDVPHGCGRKLCPPLSATQYVVLYYNSPGKLTQYSV